MFHFGPGPKQKDYNTDTDLIRSEIGIIVDGNKSALGASTGQYVILKNSTITGKTDGLYKAAQAIPANTAIDGSYLTAVSGGLGAEVASANSSISTLNGKFTTSYEAFPSDKQSGNITLVRNGNIRQLTFEDAKLPANSPYFTFTNGYLNESDRPKILTTEILKCDSSMMLIWVRPAGSFGQTNGIANGLVNGTITWIV